MLRFLWRIVLVCATLAIVLVAAAALYLHFRPIPITSPRVLLNAILGKGIPAPNALVVAQRLQAPPGFSVSVYARDLPMVRLLHVTAAGDLLASRPRAGEIVLLERDRNGDGLPDGQRVLLSGLNRPHGIDIADGWLYVGENDAIGRVQFDEQSGQLRGEYTRIVTGLTGEGNHWTKTVRIGPDGYLYLAQGSTCNVCQETDERRATIMRFNRDGSGGEIYARGLRNSVGMDWAPWDNSLYATDNGRDLLGDNFPPCELNRIRQGGFYGWPYINGFGVRDPDSEKNGWSHGREELLKNAIAPAHGFRPHNAPLGIHFLRGAHLPKEFERTALVALHGSWNRREPDGYKVVALHWRDDDSIEESDFLTGFERHGDIIGRPVDVAEDANGTIYVSDDYAGAIYRIAYGAKTPIANNAAPAAQPVVDTQLNALEERAALRAQGEALYRQYHCASCHEKNASDATATIHILRDLNTRYTVQQLQALLKTPTPPMPIFPMSDDERRAVAVYLLTHH